MASIIAIFALARAIVWAFEAPEDLNEMELSESKPTAMTVSRIMSDRVTTRAKPRFREGGKRVVTGFEMRVFIRWIQGAIGWN